MIPLLFTPSSRKFKEIFVVFSLPLCYNTP